MAEERGFFAWLARAVVRRRGWIVLAWVLAALALNAFVPQLDRAIAQSNVSFIPDSAPTVRALSTMDEKFGGNGARSVVFVVLADEGGLDQRDREFYADLVHRIRADPAVASVQDSVTEPELASSLESRDGTAIYVPVGLRGGNGAPETTAQIESLRELGAEGRPDGLAVHVTGQIATVADMQAEIERSLAAITLVTVGLILLILLVIYRSVVTALIILGAIGLELATARAVTALCGVSFFEVSTFTASLLTAVVLGAGTDYGVFLVSRFHEGVRGGLHPQRAVVLATSRVAGVIAASAATVIAACAGMAFAEVSLYRTTGPAIAMSLLVTLLAGLTLIPATLSLAADRGLALPRGQAMGRGWRRLSLHTVRRPWRVLALGLAALVLLAVWYPAADLSYDERRVQPASTDSNLGYRAMEGHFPETELMPEYVLITADHDLRNSRDLAAIEAASANVSTLDGVRVVRSVTRPAGQPLTEASVAHQAGIVGDRLGEASDRLAQGRTDRLEDGAGRLVAGGGTLAEGARSAVDGAQRLLDGLTEAGTGTGAVADGAEQARDGAQRLTAGAGQLADGLEFAAQQAELAVDGLQMAHEALESDPLCDVDPICARAREGIGEIYLAQRDQLLPGLREAAQAARTLAAGGDRLDTGISGLESGITRIRSGIDRLAEGQRTMRDRLGELSRGAEQLTDGADELHDGTRTMTGSVRELEDGLTTAADFLRTTRADAGHGGFHLPANAWQDPRMALARGMFLSADGRTARLMVLHETDPMSPEAMQRTDRIKSTVEQSLRGTPLHDAETAMTGTASVLRDLERMSNADFAKFAAAALIAVLLVLVLLLRSLVAPLYLLASVILSYAAAMGVAVLFWQHLLGTELEWSVQAITFVILVAVGADYNMLLMSRIRERSAEARAGIARATAATGTVITTAGLIFAASMFALMAGSVQTLTQIGFTIGIGLLIDTFVVRTLIIPAAATILRQHNWWPSRPQVEFPEKREEVRQQGLEPRTR